MIKSARGNPCAPFFLCWRGPQSERATDNKGGLIDGYTKVILGISANQFPKFIVLDSHPKSVLCVRILCSVV